jgi:drug/metabolite transporter (DMT)-like permease
LTLPIDVILLVMLAALCHACWNAVIKIGGDRVVVLAVVNLVGAVLSLLALPFVEVPAPQAWPWLLGSVAVHVLYYYFLVQQYRVGDLSHVYPLSRGLSPMLVALGAALIVGEVLSLRAMLGIALASVGVLSLAFDRGPPWKGDARPVLFASGTAIIIATYTVIDGIGVRHSGSAFGYIAWLFVLDGVPLTVFVAYRRGRELTGILAREWRKSLFGGTLALVAYGLVIWAMSRGPMAQVSAIRETSVIFATLIGVYMLKESFGIKRVIASALVACGLILLNTS